MKADTSKEVTTESDIYKLERRRFPVNGNNRDAGPSYELATRSAIMDLLSDEEIERVSLAESEDSIDEGDEYVNLDQLQLGVCRAGADEMSMANILPRKALDERTWTGVVKQLNRGGGNPNSF